MSKLFVVGETSPNPKDWSIWSEYVLVLANSPNEALRLSDRQGEKVTEIPMDKSVVLVSMSEPDWGRDL